MELGRWYNVPTLNRFASADSIVPNPANPQSFNRYSYSYNNPVNGTDPTGHFTCQIGSDGVAAGVTTTDCETWVNDALSVLELTETGAQIVEAFWAADAAAGEGGIIIEVGGTVSLIHSTGFVTSFNINDALASEANFIGETMYLRPEMILSDPFDPLSWEIDGLNTFAHEAIHAVQGFWNAFSLYGEVEAYYYEYQLVEEFNALISDYNSGLEDGDEGYMRDLRQHPLAQRAGDLDSPWNTPQNVRKFRKNYPMHPVVGVLPWAPYTGGGISLKIMNNRKYFLIWFIFSLMVVASCQGNIRNLPEGVSFFRTEVAFDELEWLPNNSQIVGTSPVLPLSGINIGRIPSEVYVWDSTSNNLNQISDEAFSYWSEHPVWHPNLDLVMYFSIDEFGEDHQLGAIDSSGNIVVKLDGRNADWIPNKNEIVVNRGSSLSLFDTETQRYRTLTLWRAEKGWRISEVAVSPNGREVAILITDGSPVTHVLVINLSQGEAQKIYESQKRISQISWGASGNELLFLTSGTFNELWAISVDGQCITKPFVFGYEFKDVTWSPNGEVIAASTNDEVTGIFLLNTNSDLIQDWLNTSSCQ